MSGKKYVDIQQVHIKSYLVPNMKEYGALLV